LNNSIVAPPAASSVPYSIAVRLDPLPMVETAVIVRIPMTAASGRAQGNSTNAMPVAMAGRASCVDRMIAPVNSTTSAVSIPP